MPVLDARALKADPKGSAFLLSVLRRSVPSDSKPSPVRTGPTKRRTELLKDGAELLRQKRPNQAAGVTVSPRLAKSAAGVGNRPRKAL
jgi:hypothetical protein